MSYNTNIPNVSDPLLQSQAQIRANYQAIEKAWDSNHWPLINDPEFQGMHNVLTMRPQSGDPTTQSNTVALYNKLDSNSIPELFFRPNSNQPPIQLTYPSLVNEGDQQYTFVAGPFVVYAGLLKNVSNNQLVTLSPTTTLIYVGLTGTNYVLKANPLGTLIPVNISGSTFHIKWAVNPFTSIDCYYLAIGM